MGQMNVIVTLFFTGKVPLWLANRHNSFIVESHVTVPKWHVQVTNPPHCIVFLGGGGWGRGAVSYFYGVPYFVLISHFPLQCFDLSA